MAITVGDNEAIYDNDKDTFPESSALTGTMSTGYRKDQIIGSGTTFTTELQNGDYLYDSTNDELRKIRVIKSDTELMVDREFSNTLAGASLKKTPPGGYAMLSYLISATGPEKINNSEVPADTANTFEKTGGNSRKITPIIVDSTVSGGKIYLTFR